MGETRPRFAELFAGAGGLSMGLQRAGFACAWHAEWNDDARAVLSHHWPDVPLYGDVTTLDGRDLTATHGPIDLLSGGSPCQDLSVAGKRAGMTEGSGTRSSLFFEQMRLWDECGADLCLWENVDGARSSNEGKDFGAVLRAFVGAAIAVPSDGWRSAGVAAGPTGVAAWRVLDAQYFGVPQRRRRVFVLGTRTGRVDPAEVLSLAEGVRWNPSPRREAREVAPSLPASGAGTARTGNERTECGLTVISFTQDSEPLVSHNVSQSLKIGTGFDIGQPPCVVAFDTTQITSVANRSNPQPGDPCHPLAAGAHPPLVAYSIGSHAGAADAEISNESHDAGGPTGFGITEELANTLRAGRTQAVCLTGDTIAPTLSASMGRYSSPDIERTGTPVVLEVASPLMAGGRETGPHGALDGENLVIARCVTAGEGQRNDWETCTLVVGTLDSREKGGGFPGSDGAMSGHVQAPTGIPRRLTPRECERLMGWPDDHTLVTNSRGKPMSDAGRYKMCGNGVASPVMHWIGERLAAALGESA